MAKIVSTRGRKAPAAPQQVVHTETQIFIYSAGGDVQPLTKEEMEEIGRVFDSIRKQLGIIIHCQQDWMF